MKATSFQTGMQRSVNGVYVAPEIHVFGLMTKSDTLLSSSQTENYDEEGGEW